MAKQVQAKSPSEQPPTMLPPCPSTIKKRSNFDLVADLFPESSHVSRFNLEQADDGVIWDYAQEHGFIIVSKDSDFYQRSLLQGYPPKFVYLHLTERS